VAPGVQCFAARTPTLPPATHTNSYALGEREVLLVEPATPYEDEQRAWLDWARRLAAEGRTLVAILLTHHHVDHVGGAERLAGELALPLWAHARTAERLPGLAIGRSLDEGERIVLDGGRPQSWTCLHTPGHAPGHLCLHEPALGALVVGDMVASEGTILIDPIDGDMGEYLRQLERLASLGAALALPAHGAPIDAPERLFRHYVAHRAMRERRVLDALVAAGAAGADADALLPVAYADTARALWPIARLSLEAHLIELERQGRARRAATRWLGA
jgi:glyoxylase-like metal-dependent hydrolase (beta-lactamase superfamily II)